MSAQPAAIEAPPSSRHLPVLDGVRGFAVLMVLLLHFSTFLQPPPGSIAADIRAVFQVGWAGVDVFFALSGFLITGILVDAKGGERFFRTFYARRVLRIFPLYYAMLAFYFIIAPRVLGADYSIPFWQQAYYLTFLGNFQPGARAGEIVGILWSLGIEEQFYLVWPLLIYFCNRWQAVIACTLFVIGAFAYRFIELNMGASGWLVYHFTPGRIDGLALGALSAIAIRTPRGATLLKRYSLPVAITGALVLIALTLHERGMTPASANREHMSFGLSALALFCSAVIANLVTADAHSLAVRLSTWRPLRAMGKYSYAMYVLHTTVLRVASKVHLMPSHARLLAHPLLWMLVFPGLMVGATYGTGMLSWNLLEKRVLALKKYFEYSRRPVAASPSQEYHSSAALRAGSISPTDTPLPS